jgi:two-component system chemotaxis sensor kinase CheA
MSANDPAETFRQEAQELLEQLEQALLDLEHAPGDSDLIDSAFRALHTIKGSGAMFGFDALATFTHHVETAFDLVRKGKVSAGPDLIAITLSAMDRMRVLLEESGPIDPGPGDMILRELKAIVDAETVPGVGAAPASMTYRIRFWLARDAMAMGTNPLFLLDELRALGSASVSALTDRVPPLDMLVPTDCYIGWDVVLTTEQPRAAIEDVFMFVIDGMELSIETIAPGSDPLIGEILIQRGDVPQEEVAAALSRQAPLGALLVESGAVSEVKLAAAVAEQRHVRAEAKVEKVDKSADSIRIPAAKLDELMERVGELVIAQSRLSQIAAVSAQSEVKSIAEEIERLTLALRDTTMGVRTLPIGSLFGRFRRLVHDLSRDLGKEIELVTIGEETELDKTVIERLNDPLIHLIRNSIDHGLETPEVRRAAGKPECGRITLLARHAGAEVLVSIIDDGKGLDRARIRARAEENGLLPVGVTVSDAELFQLIFEPGFSTAQEVTSLSGRGVGMDVVKRTIKALRGKIDIESTPGVGSEISLRLPLTLAIIDGLLIRVGTQRYVLPLSAVVECVELSSEEDARSHGRNFLNIRGDLVPFLRLRQLFQTSTPADLYQKAVIVSAGDLRVGLVVDQVIGNHQTVVKSLSSLHADLKTFSGATILGDGTVALILDIVHLIELGQTQENRMRAAE